MTILMPWVMASWAPIASYTIPKASHNIGDGYSWYLRIVWRKAHGKKKQFVDGHCFELIKVSPTKGSCPVNPDQFRMALIGGQNNSIRQKWGQRPEFIIPKPTRLVYNFQPTKGHDDSKANSAQLKSKNNLTSPDLLSMQSGSLSPRRHLTQIAHINTTTFMRLFN